MAKVVTTTDCPAKLIELARRPRGLVKTAVFAVCQGAFFGKQVPGEFS
jgi:hypothetical protein